MKIKNLYNCKKLVGILIQIKDDLVDPTGQDKKIKPLIETIDQWNKLLLTLRPPIVDQITVDNLQSDLQKQGISIVEKELNDCINGTYVENISVN